MNAAEQVMQFNRDFREMINRAVRENVPLSPMILTLDDAKFELQTMLLALRRQAQAEELTHKIVPVGQINLSPPRNGAPH